MKKVFCIFFLIQLCLAYNGTENDIHVRYKRAMIVDKIPSYPTLPESIKYYVQFKEENPISMHLQFISNRICLSFSRQKKLVSKKGINFLKSIKKSDIKLPKKTSGSANIYLRSQDLKNIRLILHYIGLALGLVPEIQRFDRNRYLKIYWGNLNPIGLKYYKKKKHKTKHYTSFDFGSIMLRSPTYGTIDQKIAFKTNLYPYYDLLINKRDRFSHYDFKILANAYCKKKCPDREICKNGGYQASNCKECVCNRFFTGQSCEKILEHDSSICGSKQYFDASSTKGYLTAKNIKGPCYYWIKPKKNRNTKIVIKNVHFDGKVSCVDDKGLFIHYRKDKGVTPLCLFKDNENFTLPLLPNDVYIIFSGLGQNNSFSISYQAVKQKNKKSVKT
uniref:Astacin domain-containing protein n=1 Tax=Strongyloides venezuelensis TaxID=75913 RepID=A0A0K0F3J0_STRVS